MHASAWLVGFAGLITTGPADTLRDQIVRTDRQVDAALRERDIPKFESVIRGGVTADFRHIELGRAITFPQMVAQMKQGLGAMAKITVAKTTLVSLAEKGARATAETSHQITGTFSGSDHKPHTVTIGGMTTDVYRREGGKWKLASMTWVSQRQLMDGKPITPRSVVTSPKK